MDQKTDSPISDMESVVNDSFLLLRDMVIYIAGYPDTKPDACDEEKACQLAEQAIQLGREIICLQEIGMKYDAHVKVRAEFFDRALVSILTYFPGVKAIVLGHIYDCLLENLQFTASRSGVRAWDLDRIDTTSLDVAKTGVKYIQQGRAKVFYEEHEQSLIDHLNLG